MLRVVSALCSNNSVVSSSIPGDDGKTVVNIIISGGPVIMMQFVVISIHWLNIRIEMQKENSRTEYLSFCRNNKANIIEPVHEISNNVVCATSKASDKPAHMQSLIRAFACRFNIL